MKFGIINVTNRGKELAKIVADRFDGELYSKDTTTQFDLKGVTEELFYQCDALIFIASTGIAVRAIAPFIKDKTVDPAVIVIDVTGKYVVSLLSGHLGGANKLTSEIAELIKGIPVITTATDNLYITAPDIFAEENNLIIDDMKKAKEIAAMLVDGKKVAYVEDGFNYEIPNGYIKKIENADGAVVVTNKLDLNKKFENKTILKLIKKNVVVGIGCRKSFDILSMKKNVYQKLKEANMDYRAVSKICTVEVKKEEAAIIELSKELKAELQTFSVSDIKKIDNKYVGSDFVEKTIGVRSVCEPCVDLGGAKPITSKIKCNGMTMCIGELITI